jgi:hypothetical protein
MALSRKLLKGMGLTDEQVDTIIEAHTDVVDGLKDEINSNKDAVKKLAEVTKERDELKAQGDDGYKEKYDKEHSDFEKFKADVAAEKAQADKEKAYRAMLKDVLSEKGVEKAVKYADWSKIELDEKGELKNASEHVKAVKEEWSEHVSNSVIHNAPVPNPPINTGGTAKTKEQIMAIKDGTARRKAIAENLSLFGANPSNSNE